MTSIIRSPRDFWTGVIYVAFGLAAIVIGRGYEMGTATKMGPAYFPTVLGGLLIFIGLIAMIRSFIQPGEPIGKFALKEAFLILGATILFGLLVRGAGLIVALVVLVMMSAYASAKFRWVSSVALAVGLTVFCVAVFVKGLRLPLPIVGAWFGG